MKNFWDFQHSIAAHHRVIYHNIFRHIRAHIMQGRLKIVIWIFALVIVNLAIFHLSVKMFIYVLLGDKKHLFSVISLEGVHIPT